MNTRSLLSIIAIVVIVVARIALRSSRDTSPSYSGYSSGSSYNPYSNSAEGNYLNWEHKMDGAAIGAGEAAIVFDGNERADTSTGKLSVLMFGERGDLLFIKVVDRRKIYEGHKMAEQSYRYSEDPDCKECAFFEAGYMDEKGKSFNLSDHFSNLFEVISYSAAGKKIKAHYSFEVVDSLGEESHRFDGTFHDSFALIDELPEEDDLGGFDSDLELEEEEN